MKTWQDLIDLAKKKNAKAKAAASNNETSEAEAPRKAALSLKARKNENAALHAGHRSRMRERFEQDPELATFAEHEVLELLLFNSVCRKDTNALAHKLINEFGSLVNVMDASFDSLRRAGLSDISAVQIKQVLAISDYYLLGKMKNCVYVNNINQVAGFFGVYFANRNHECVYVALLDANGRVLSLLNLGKGGPMSTEIDTYKLLAAVSSKGAVRVVLMHNHPAGNLLPSRTDISTTGNIMIQLAIMQTSLLDHIIFGSNGNYFSFYQNGLMTALGDRCRAFMGDDKDDSGRLNDNLKLRKYSCKGKSLNYESYATLENEILRNLDDFDADDLTELAAAVKSDPVFGNFFAKDQT